MTHSNRLDSHFISFIHRVQKTINRVTNRPAVAHKNWVVRCSLALWNFSRSNKQAVLVEIYKKYPVLSSQDEI